MFVKRALVGVLLLAVSGALAKNHTHKVKTPHTSKVKAPKNGGFTKASLLIGQVHGC